MHLIGEGKGNHWTINKYGIEESVDIHREWPIAGGARISPENIFMGRRCHANGRRQVEKTGRSLTGHRHSPRQKGKEKNAHQNEIKSCWAHFTLSAAIKMQFTVSRTTVDQLTSA